MEKNVRRKYREKIVFRKRTHYFDSLIKLYFVAFTKNIILLGHNFKTQDSMNKISERWTPEKMRYITAWNKSTAIIYFSPYDRLKCPKQKGEPMLCNIRVPTTPFPGISHQHKSRDLNHHYQQKQAMF